MDGAYDAGRGVVLPSHPPQFFALGEGQLQPPMAAGNGAFDLELSGHFPNITTAAQGRAVQAGRVASLTRFCQQGHTAQRHDPSIRNVSPGNSSRPAWLETAFFQPWLEMPTPRS